MPKVGPVVSVVSLKLAHTRQLKKWCVLTCSLYANHYFFKLRDSLGTAVGEMDS